MAYTGDPHIAFNKPVGITQAIPVDARTYYFDSLNFRYREYISTAEVLAYLDLPKYRKGHFSIIINTGGALSDGIVTGGVNNAYWFKDGVTDAHLVVMNGAGTIGPIGPAGPIGPIGPQGPTGAQGPAGSVGPPGAPGATGPMGSVGPMGPQGPIGATGATGPMGPPGIAGESGDVIGVAPGGTAGQVLTKIDSVDYNTYWSTPSAGGGGGSLSGDV